METLITILASPGSALGSQRTWNGHMAVLANARSEKRRRPMSQLSRPVIITAPTNPLGGTLIQYVQPPRRAFKIRSTLRPPTVVNSDTFTPCARVTDNFTRADENPIVGIWKLSSTTLTSGLAIVSNALTIGVGAGAYLAQKVDPIAPWQSEITIGNLGTAGVAQLGIARASNGLQRVLVNIFPDGRVRLSIFGGTVGETTRTLHAGDKFAVRAVPSGANTTYTVYHFPFGGSGYQPILKDTDSIIDWSVEPVNLPFIVISDASWTVTSFSFCPYANDGPAVTSARRPRTRTMSRLAEPITPSSTAVFFGPESRLAASSRLGRRAKYALPKVLPINVGSFGGPRVKLVAPLSPAHQVFRKRNSSDLLPPPPIPQVTTPARPIRVELAYSRRGQAKSKLLDVVYDAVSYEPIRGLYLPGRTRNPQGDAKLAPPQVVFAPENYGGPHVRLRNPISTVPRTIWKLRPPAVVAQLGATYPISVSLAYSRRGTPKSILRTPTGGPGLVYAPLRVVLHPLVPFPRKAKSKLSAPAVVATAPVLYPINVALAYSRRGFAKSRLLPVPAAFRPVGSLSVHLVKIRPPRTIAHLVPPAVIDLRPQTYYIATSLAYSRRGAPKSFLFKPTDLVDQQDLGYVRTHLAYSRRGAPKSTLRPPTGGPGIVYAPLRVVLYSLVPFPRKAKSELSAPTVVNAFQASSIATSLAYSRRGTPKSKLGAPVVVNLAIAIYGPYVSLAYSRRGTPKSILRRPTDLVDEQDKGAVATSLAYSRRGAPKSTLRPPTGGDGVVYAPLRVVLHPLIPFPREAKSKLSPPAAVQASRTTIIGTHLAYSKRGRPIYRLEPPAVVDYFRVPVLGIHLAYSRRGAPKSFLRQPLVVIGPILAAPIRVTFARIKPPPTMARLAPPTDLVDQQDVGYLRVHLAYSRRGTPKSILHPPTVVGPVLARAIDVTLAKIRPVKTTISLAPPVVVYLAVEIYGPVVELAYSRRGAPKSFLKPPTDLVDQQDIGKLAVHLVRIRPVRTVAELKPPTVIDNSPQVYYLAVNLAYSRRGTPKSFLKPPTDLVDQQDLGYLRTHLTYSRRGAPKSTLRPPTVVFPFIARPTDVELAYSRRGAPKSRLQPPTYVDLRPQVYYLATSLAYSRRGAPKSILGKPTLIGAGPPQTYFLSVHLVRIRPVAVHPHLSPPAVVAPVLARAILTKLVRITPPPTSSRLKPPTDLVDAQDQGSVAITLAYSRRGRPIYRLEPPAVVAQVLARPTEIALVKIRPAKTLYHLGSPVYVFASFARPVAVTLARIKPPPTMALLGRPTDVVDDQDKGTVAVTLAYSLRGRPKSILRPPTVIDLRPQVYSLSVTLTYSRRGTPKSVLSPPPEIQVVPQSGPGFIWLTYSLRGRPKSILRKPAVIDVRPQTYFISTTLAYSLRGKPKSRLLPVPAAFRPVGSVEVHLAYSRRGQAKSFLPLTVLEQEAHARPIVTTFVRIRPPFAMARFTGVVYEGRVYAPVTVNLAPSKRGQPKSFLTPPAVVDRERLATISVTLAPSFRGIPKSSLKPPTVVRERAVYSLAIHLAYSRRGQPVSFLKPPTVLRAPFVAAPIKVALVRIRPVPVYPHLVPPAVVNEATPVLYPIRVTLVRIRPRRTLWFLGPPNANICYGIVCGFDYGPVVCGDDSGPSVTGGDAPEATVSGSDSGATVSGATAPSGTVSGGDERREGC